MTTARPSYVEVLPPTASSRHRAVEWTPAEPGPCGARGDLAITTGRGRVVYHLYEFPVGSDFAGRAFQLVKADGTGHYAVLCAADGRSHRCDCLGKESQASERQLARAIRASDAAAAYDTAGCKHIDGCLALIANGWV